MTNLDSTGTSRAAQPPRGAKHNADHATPGSATATRERPEAKESDDLDGRSGRRTSPDPLVATDRYRLTMPFADEV
ncbi:MAG: hypothetical protein HZB39_04925 [Planctomycetes bacterium]|nr:hypothetical protein [Planctomycetota bacterium]